VSEENLAAIRKRGGQYLTGTPRSQMKQFEAELLKEDWTRVRPEVEVKKVPIPHGEETYILCRTWGRAEKEKAIRKRFSNSMATALKGLEKAIVARRLKDRNKMKRRLEKIQARHPQVNDLYDLLCAIPPKACACSGRSKKIARTGANHGKALICCAPISNPRRRKSCGRSTCS
jgi:transposase